MNNKKILTIRLLLHTAIQILMFILDDEDDGITEKSTTPPSAVEGSTPAIGVKKQDNPKGINMLWYEKWYF